MKAHSILSVSPLLADRVRLAIMVAISASKDPVDFTTLLTALELSRGNLSTHLRKLEEGGLVDASKEFVDRKPRSTYRPTAAGREAIRAYLKIVEQALKEIKR